MDISEKDLTGFITDYVSELQRITLEKQKEIADVKFTPNFPTEFPAKATVFFGSRGIFINIIVYVEDYLHSTCW